MTVTLKPLEEGAFFDVMERALQAAHGRGETAPMRADAGWGPKEEHAEGASLRRQVHAICAYIDEHYRQPLSLSQLAERFAFHPNYLSGAFRERIGESFVEYLTRVRLRHAKEMLSYTEQSVRAIAEATGVGSQAYFQRVFKRTEGMTPQAYRERHGHTPWEKGLPG